MSKLNFNSLKMCLVTLKHKNTFISMFLMQIDIFTENSSI